MERKSNLTGHILNIHFSDRSDAKIASSFDYAYFVFDNLLNVNQILNSFSMQLIRIKVSSTHWFEISDDRNLLLQ